jgi:hypothetical protein
MLYNPYVLILYFRCYGATWYAVSSSACFSRSLLPSPATFDVMQPFHGYGSGYLNTMAAPYNTMSTDMASAPTTAHASSHHVAYSSHYAQAYQVQHYPLTYSASGLTETHSYGALSLTSRPVFHPPSNSSSWYSPGTCHCTYPDCNFVGSAKSLEIHCMDRHLIYPPGWKERKRKPDWDADPSLMGCVQSAVVSRRGEAHSLFTPNQETGACTRYRTCSGYAGED